MGLYKFSLYYEQPHAVKFYSLYFCT